MCRCALLTSEATLNDLLLLFSMHLSWHSNSSTTVIVSMTLPSKTWPKKEKKTTTFYWCKLKRLTKRKEKAGQPLIWQVFTYQLGFQKGLYKSLCLPPQITFPGECWELQWPAELTSGLPLKVLCCAPDYSSLKRLREMMFDSCIIFFCEFGPKRKNIYAVFIHN